MSYLAVGSVTQSIAALLGAKLNKPPLLGATATFRVTTLPPDDDRVNDQTGINLFLYRIHENPFTKNMSYRGDRNNPLKGAPPPLSLTLSYLLTAYVQKTGGTAQDDITTHQLLGNAMSILHDYPVLNDVHDGDFDANVDGQFPPELRNAFDKVKITLLPTTMDEYSKIWTGLSKAYRLSVAYEVSLVEIGPGTPVSLPNAAVQLPGVGINTFVPPQIFSVTPQSGAVGTVITITGQNLQRPGSTTTVEVGGVTVSQDQLLSLSGTQIQLAIPVAVEGPQLWVAGSVDDSQSQLLSFTVTPWIGTLTPLRGITGIPVTIPINLPPAATVLVTIGGLPAAVTADPQGKFVTATVPAAIANNGLQPVVMTLNGQVSNSLSFEVLPLISAVAVTSNAAPVSTTITITGERLAGQDVSATVGGLLIRTGVNTNATQLVVTVARTLPATTPVTVTVDGRVSNTIPPTLDAIAPASAHAGDSVVLTGDGLSGRNVTVSFNAVVVTVGAQPIGSRMTVSLPANLLPGVIQVTVTVDGRATNALPLAVLA